MNMQSSADRIWAAAQERLRAIVSVDLYNLWFAQLRASAQDQNHLALEVADDFCGVWLKDNYIGLLEDAVAKASGRPMEIVFKVGAGPMPVPV